MMSTREKEATDGQELAVKVLHHFSVDFDETLQRFASNGGQDRVGNQMAVMRADLSTIQQILTPEAAAALTRAIDEAARKGHGQTTPLHVAAALLAAKAGLLRQACARVATAGVEPGAARTPTPPRLHALELCFFVALDRLPVAASAAARHASGPPVSNALFAALKRAQVASFGYWIAPWVRQCPDAAQQPLLAVQVGLEQLVLSLLDDPSVSRVMSEASFSSTAVKTTIEQSLASPSAVSIPTVAAGGGRDDARRVLDVMLNPARRNPVLVGKQGNAGADAVLKEAVRRIPMVGSPALAGAKVLPLLVAGDKATMAARIGDLSTVVQRLLADHNAVVLDIGDLKWLVDGPLAAASEWGEAVVSEMARLLRRFGSGKVWAVGTASCATYLRCKVYYPTMEAEWDLQAVPIASSALDDPSVSHVMSEASSSAAVKTTVEQSLASPSPPSSTAVAVTTPAVAATMPALSYMEFNILERIVNESEEPGPLDFTLLHSITENFSEKNKIGSGGCGIVYKGILRNGVVAVKKLHNSWTIENKMFHREVISLISVKHQNIVRFLGYCSFTKEHAVPYGGITIMAEIRERLLCFEYIRNASLDKYISDELRGLEWQTRYQIIIGICRGLHYLHKDKEIIHMDLKPGNILLDNLMVPKITDFGLSRPISYSQATTTPLISRGYTAPEYISRGKATSKADIYSLGVIIIELVTGSRTKPNIIKVLRRWNHRWIKSMKQTSLGYRQVEKCLELALRCIQDVPTDRPDISDIIGELKETDATDGQTPIQISPCCLEDILGVEPLEIIHIPFEDLKVSHSIELTNDTDDYIAFVTKAKLEHFCTEPDRGIVPPRSKYSVILVMGAHVNAQPNKHYTEVITVLSTRVDDGALAAMDILTAGDIFIDRKEGKVVDEVNVMVVFGTPKLPEEES